MKEGEGKQVVELWTYPSYVGKSWIGPKAPVILRTAMQLAKVEVKPWDGKIDSLPGSSDRAIMVWASSTLSCDRDALVERCRELGHFCFYYDQPLTHPSDSAAEAVKRWFDEKQDGR